MDIRIHTFLNLYKTMNYHETARQLVMSQPSVTQHIKSLESEYDCHFFIYERKKLNKTKEADLFEAYAKSAVFNQQKLMTALHQPVLHCFRIGATKSIGEYMLHDMTAAFLSDPSYTAEITVDNTAHLLQMLDDSRIDFALVEGNFNKQRYASRLFKSEPLCGICGADHRLNGRRVKIENLFSETLILREPGSGTRRIFCDILSSCGYTTDRFKRCVSISDFSLLSGLIADGVGISYVYQAVADHTHGLGTFAIKGINPKHDLQFVFLKDTNAESMIEMFTGALS